MNKTNQLHILDKNLVYVFRCSTASLIIKLVSELWLIEVLSTRDNYTLSLESSFDLRDPCLQQAANLEIKGLCHTQTFYYNPISSKIIPHVQQAWHEADGLLQGNGGRLVWVCHCSYTIITERWASFLFVSVRSPRIIWWNDHSMVQ